MIGIVAQPSVLPALAVTIPTNNGVKQKGTYKIDITTGSTMFPGAKIKVQFPSLLDLTYSEIKSTLSGKAAGEKLTIIDAQNIEIGPLLNNK